MAITPNLFLNLPEPNVTSGPQWATSINTAMEVIDSHDHSANKGVRITPAGLNINSLLDMQENRIQDASSIRFTNGPFLGPIGGGRTSIFVGGGELYYNDNSGNSVQITNNGSISAGSSADFIDFVIDSDPGDPSTGFGRVFALSAGGFPELNIKDEFGNTRVVGRDRVEYMTNGSGSTITKGQIVYVDSIASNKFSVDLADASASATLPGVGIAGADVLDTEDGPFVIDGIITGIDTSSFSAGDELYVSPSTPGALTATRPVHPNFAQSVAIVLASDATDGIIRVSISTVLIDEASGTNQNRFTIGDGAATAKSLAFDNGTESEISWNPTTRQNLIYPPAAPTSGQSMVVSSVTTNAGVEDVVFGWQSSAGSPTVHTVSSANYTILDGDGYGTILVSTGASDRTITLPDASSNTNRQITVKKTDSGSGEVIVSRAGSDAIDTGTQYNIILEDAFVSVVSDGSNWSIVNEKFVPDEEVVTVDLSSATPFNAGTVEIVRVGRQVTISSILSITHTSSASPSVSGVIPARFRPEQLKRNVTNSVGSIVTHIQVSPDGTFGSDYRDWAGSPSNQTVLGVSPCISYSIPSSNYVPIRAGVLS